ncbi:MAG: SEL1-like repeat protein, partial [Thermoguttaceae bacterium]|nr:SEL1-like repeat protein [Thermoguttaceae bacterium]
MIAENPETCFALLIGVDEYETLGKLEYASSDAKALRDALLDIGFCRENIALCVSDGPRQTLPTKKNIDSAIDEILDAAAKAGKNSTIFIAFAGHGFEMADGDAAFCPQDAAVKWENKRQTVIRDTVVVINDLTARLREHPAEFKILLVDACRELADARGGNDELEGFQGNINASGIACLRSCSLGQKSFEAAEFKSGVFTHYFIEGLKGKAATANDGGVTFLNACSYTSMHTRDYVQETRKKLQVPYHDFKGVDFFLRAPARNEAEDNYRQGRALAWGLDGTKIDGFRALELLTQAANAGLNDAKAALALLYFEGCEATPPNFTEAVKWAILAGENPVAQHVLGGCYKNGLGVNKDEEKTKRFYEAAFEEMQTTAKNSDDPLILHLLTYSCYYGLGTKLDYVKAAEYCRRAADLNCAVSLANLAGMYCLGNGVERDYARAIKLYNAAIEQNCSFAYANLGNCYRDGMGVAPDKDKAVKLYLQGIEKNDANGSLNLGVYYANSGADK